MKFLEFIGWFFKDDNGHPSMMRVLSLMNEIAGIVFGTMMMIHALNEGTVNPYEFYLSGYFVLLAILGKGSQKLVEKYIDKK